MTSNIDNTEYIKCSRCHMKFINDDEHIKTDFGYNILNIIYKQCVRCRTYKLSYRESHRDEIKEKQKEYYYEHKEELNKKKMEYDKVYHSEKIECSMCGNTMTRKQCLNTEYHHHVKQQQMFVNTILKCWMINIKMIYIVWVKPN